MFRLVKYVFAILLVGGLFAATWGVQYLYWFPKNAFEAMTPAVFTDVMRRMDEEHEEWKRSAVEIGDADALERAYTEYLSGERERDFLARFADGEKAVYIVVETGDEPGPLSPAQREGLSELLAQWPNRRGEIVRHLLNRYRLERDEALSVTGDKRVDREMAMRMSTGLLTLEQAYPPLAGPGDFENIVDAAWLTLTIRENDGHIYIPVRYDLSQKIMHEFTTVIHGDDLIDPQDYWNEVFSEWETENEEEAEEEPDAEGNVAVS